MKIVTYVKGVVVSCGANKAQDGRVFRKISLGIGEEAGTFPCSDEVAKQYDDGIIKKFQEHSFECIYDSTYKSFRVNRLIKKITLE